MTSEELLNEIITAQREYAKVYRKTISLPRRRLAVEKYGINPDEFQSEIIRESDLEHIGHLPLVATLIHPHLEHRDKVDLGKTLLYLALHEAPERITGDVLHEDKTEDYNQAELEAANQIYSGSYSHYFDLYQDFHFIKNIAAQFAYSIDRIAPIIYYEVEDAEQRDDKWKELGLSIDKIRQASEESMQWDETMKELFNHIFDVMERQEEKKSNI